MDLGLILQKKEITQHKIKYLPFVRGADFEVIKDCRSKLNNENYGSISDEGNREQMKQIALYKYSRTHNYFTTSQSFIIEKKENVNMIKKVSEFHVSPMLRLS
jgi:hypothetical protein